MYYAIYCEDQDNSLPVRRSVRPAHLQRLKHLKEHNRLLIAGPLLNADDANPMVAGVKGSLIVAEFTNIAAARAWAAADPYVTAGVYKKVTINLFKPAPTDDQ